MRGKKNEGKGGKCWKGVWDKEGMNAFRQKVGKVEIRGRDLNENWEVIEEKIKRVIEEIKKKRKKRRKRRRGWWNEECEIKKREMRRKLRKWRR